MTARALLFTLAIVLPGCTEQRSGAPMSTPPPAVAGSCSAAAKATKSGCETAADPKACEAAGKETEGDESLVGIAGTWRIRSHFFPGISAMGEAEAAAFHGREVRVEPNLTTPWDRCKATAWSHRSTALTKWLDDVKATLTSEKIKALDLGDPVQVWEARCTVERGPVALVSLLETRGHRLVLMHEGAGFVLEPAR